MDAAELFRKRIKVRRLQGLRTVAQSVGRVIVDPSHAAGMYWMVEPLALAAVAAGADGLIVEVHNDPANAKCDGQQSLTPEKFDHLMGKISALVDLMEKTLVK